MINVNSLDIVKIADTVSILFATIINNGNINNDNLTF